MDQILEKLEKFGWHKINFSWDAGYLVLAGIIGKAYGNETIDDADFGKIYFSRDYILGDWHINRWSVTFLNCSRLCKEEMDYLNSLIQYLNSCKDPYPTGSDEPKEIVDDRLHMDEMLGVRQ